MATDVVDDREMREAQRDYLDFLDDDVSLTFLMLNTVCVREEKPCAHNKRSSLHLSSLRGFSLLTHVYNHTCYCGALRLGLL